MNCPTCGAPNVILHKDIWECGWCGDSGPIPCRILEQRKAAREKQEAWWQEAATTARWAAGENQARAGDTPQAARAREKRTRRTKAAAGRRRNREIGSAACHRGSKAC